MLLSTWAGLVVTWASQSRTTVPDTASPTSELCLLARGLAPSNQINIRREARATRLPKGRLWLLLTPLCLSRQLSRAPLIDGTGTFCSWADSERKNRYETAPNWLLIQDSLQSRVRKRIKTALYHSSLYDSVRSSEETFFTSVRTSRSLRLRRLLLPSNFWTFLHCCLEAKSPC